MTDGGGHGGASENAAVRHFHEAIHENKEHGKPSVPRRGQATIFSEGPFKSHPRNQIAPEIIGFRVFFFVFRRKFAQKYGIIFDTLPHFYPYEFTDSNATASGSVLSQAELRSVQAHSQMI